MWRLPCTGCGERGAVRGAGPAAPGRRHLAGRRARVLRPRPTPLRVLRAPLRTAAHTARQV